MADRRRVGADHDPLLPVSAAHRRDMRVRAQVPGISDAAVGVPRTAGSGFHVACRRAAQQPATARPHVKVPSAPRHASTGSGIGPAANPPGTPDPTSDAQAQTAHRRPPRLPHQGHVNGRGPSSSRAGRTSVRRARPAHGRGKNQGVRPQRRRVGAGGREPRADRNAVELERAGMERTDSAPSAGGSSCAHCCAGEGGWQRLRPIESSRRAGKVTRAAEAAGRPASRPTQRVPARRRRWRTRSAPVPAANPRSPWRRGQRAVAPGCPAGTP